MVFGIFKPKGIREMDRKRRVRIKAEKFAIREKKLQSEEKGLAQELRIEKLKTKISKTKRSRPGFNFGGFGGGFSDQGLTKEKSRKKRRRNDDDFGMIGRL
jgi:hypothetical protein